MEDSQSESEKNSDVNSNSSSLDELREKYDIKKKYKKNIFTEEESAFGNGNYPPDWNVRRKDIEDPLGGRRDAVLEYQNYRCARCNTEIQDSYNCHHYRPRYQGGTHELQNLVALCLPCHKLIHPNVEDCSGDWKDASLFPAHNADPRVATIRKPVTPKEREEYLPQLELLELISVEGENTFATSDATYSISPTDAIEAPRELEDIIENVGLSPQKEVVVRVENRQHSPLEDATVELALSFRNHTGYTTTRTTDKYGEVRFDVPDFLTGHATILKGECESTVIDISEEKEYVVRIPLQDTGTTDSHAIGDTKNSLSKNTETSQTTENTDTGSILDLLWGSIVGITGIIGGFFLLNLLLGIPLLGIMIILRARELGPLGWIAVPFGLLLIFLFLSFLSSSE